MATLWHRIERLLEDANISRVQLELSECSPLPNVEISMSGEMDIDQLMELIIRNFVKQNLNLRCSTWSVIKEIYEITKTDRTSQMFLEMLLVISKLDIDEYCKYYKKESVMPDTIYFEDSVLINFFAMMKKRIAKADIISANQTIKNVLKQFLMRNPVLTAFEEGLAQFNLDVDIQRIKKCINEMEIYFCKSLGNLIQGITLRSGILISVAYAEYFGLDLQSTVQQCMVGVDTMILKAWIVTKCYHETAHYLVRHFHDDFNFSSPNFGKDPRDNRKGLEFGSYMELQLFGLQPNWFQSSEMAATDFINNALIRNELPIISKNTDDSNYLVERETPSLSFAGDMECILTEGCVG